MIQRSGEHLLALINDILDIAKIEAGKMPFDIVAVPLPGLLGDVREIIRVKAEQKQLVFVCEAARDVPNAVRADERRLRQVLLNLLANAVKFTDSGYVSLACGDPCRMAASASRWKIPGSALATCSAS